MPGSLLIIQSRVLPRNEGSFDVEELAIQAAEALEAYQRAPWRMLSERTRMTQLRRAIELLRRIEDLESGRIPMRMRGD